jgi:hypothetical protein
MSNFRRFSRKTPYAILAGRRWKILDVDHDQHSILVEPSPGGRRPGFLPSGCGEIHPRVREVMRSLLFRDDIPGYLDPGAKEMLSRARKTAREAMLGHHSLIQVGSDVTWFTWTGTRIHRTLTVIAMHLGGSRIDDGRGIALTFERTNQDAVQRCYRRALVTRLELETLAKRFACRATEKYEPFLSEDLQCRLFGRDHLDLDGAAKEIAFLKMIILIEFNIYYI